VILYALTGTLQTKAFGLDDATRREMDRDHRQAAQTPLAAATHVVTLMELVALTPT
jgi:hypothetical protein